MKKAIFFGILFVACTPEQPTSDVSIVRGSEVTSMAERVSKSTIGYRTSGGGLCSGTLIGKNHIVSAAHCLQNGRVLSIFFGTNDQNTFDTGRINHEVHESYGQAGGTYDIVVITFEGKIPSEMIPAKVGDPEDVSSGVEIRLAGYGVTSETGSDSGTLRTVTTTIEQVLSNDNEFVQATGVNQSSRDGGGSCYGDSGGPVYLESSDNDKETNTVIGAVSRGENCDLGNGIYTDVTKYKRWMSEAFERMGNPIDFDSSGDSDNDSDGDA